MKLKYTLLLASLFLIILSVGCQREVAEEVPVTDVPEISKEVEPPPEPVQDFECTSNDDCDNNEECVGNVCQVPVCAEDEHVVNHECVQKEVECRINQDCIATEKCVDNACVPRVTQVPEDE